MEFAHLHDDLGPVSALSLGSWNTYPRLTFDDLCELLASAVEHGINFFDVGYYWDNPHTEVLFGHAMRSIGVAREEYAIAQKLWLWDYPAESFAQQVTRSLRRLGTDHVDILMVSRPNLGTDLPAYLEEIVDLIARGYAKAWGVTNWSPELIREAGDLIERRGFPRPATVQLQYSIARRSIVEDPAYSEVFREHGLSLQPADTLEGGILAGKLDRDRINPDDPASALSSATRNIARDSGGIRPRIRAMFPAVQDAAERLHVTPAQFALAYALAHPHRSTVLVGASTPQQIEENVGALALARERSDEVAAAVATLDFGVPSHPKLFSPSEPNSR